jgi:hypothetical protein
MELTMPKLLPAIAGATSSFTLMAGGFAAAHLFRASGDHTTCVPALDFIDHVGTSSAIGAVGGSLAAALLAPSREEHPTDDFFGITSDAANTGFHVALPLLGSLGGALVGLYTLDMPTDSCAVVRNIAPLVAANGLVLLYRGLAFIGH